MKREEEGANAEPPPNQIILYLTYCRIEGNGLFYMRAVRDSVNVEITRLKTFNGRSNIAGAASVNATDSFIINWSNNGLPADTWYSIEMGQDDGSLLDAGITSTPEIEILNPPLGWLMKFRINISKPIPECVAASVCVEPPRGTILKPPKNIEIKPMEQFEMEYTKSNVEIGAGAFGNVSIVTDNCQQTYAAKVIKTLTQKKKGNAVREYNMMMKLQHPRLVQLNDAYESKTFFVLVMEYLWGGELFDRIVEDEYVKEVDVVPYVRQICEGLAYMHSQKIAHLDVKPENVVCLTPNCGRIKIIDLGLARVLEDDHMTRAIYGTKDYVAPEVLNYDKLTIACDMWSLGVVTYVLLSGIMPFTADTWPERSSEIMRANYNYNDSAFDGISDLAKDFVDKLLVVRVSQRMTAETALKHKWLTEGPPKYKAGHMKKMRDNLKSYLANHRARWQRAGNVMIAAHRLRAGAVAQRADDGNGSPRVT